MAKRSHNRCGRSELFVVRVWPSASGETADQAAGAGGRGAWGGRVQRASNGEGRDFAGWPDLIAALEGLLAAARPITSERRDDGTESGNSTGE